MINKSRLEAVLTKFEGFVRHMYLDSAQHPNVTIGIGHLIEKQADAGTLPLYFKEESYFCAPVSLMKNLSLRLLIAKHLRF